MVDWLIELLKQLDVLSILEEFEISYYIKITKGKYLLELRQINVVKRMLVVLT